jgi:hypothetical protein
MSTRFEGSFNITDTPALVRALGRASDDQLKFWFECAKVVPNVLKQENEFRLKVARELILAEMGDRVAVEYRARYEGGRS